MSSVEQVDELINELAKHIKEIILSGECPGNEVADKTKALAELIDARANYRMAFRTFEFGSTSQI